MPGMCGNVRSSGLRFIILPSFITYDLMYIAYYSKKSLTIAAPICTGLKTEWTSTIKTTTQFPADPGTVVEVTCSNSDAVNEGSSRVTCTIRTDFTFTAEPKCSIPGSYFYNFQQNFINITFETLVGHIRIIKEHSKEFELDSN